MNLRIKGLVALLMIGAMLSLVSCGAKEYTTVADDITKDSTEYTEMERIALKGERGSDRTDIGYCAVLIPNDYVASDEVEGMYVSALYPLDASNIYYTIQDASTVGYVNGELTENTFKDAIEGGYRDLNDPVELTIDEFVRDNMEGIPCYKIRYHYTVSGQELQQLCYIIMAKETHVITYTQMDDDDLFADFVHEDAAIRLVRERSQA